MRAGMQKAGLSSIPNLEKIFEEMDIDGSGIIDYTEFIAACLDKKTYMQEDVCWSAFRGFDKNGDGKISQQELSAILSDESVQQVAGDSLKVILQSNDLNSDGFIDFQEFMAMMRKDDANKEDQSKQGLLANNA